MNLNNFYKRHYFEKGIIKNTTAISKEFDKEILWLIYYNPISVNSNTNHQIDFALMIRKKLPKDFLKNL